MLRFQQLRDHNAERCRETQQGLTGLSASKLALDVMLAANRAWTLCSRIEQGEAIDPDLVMRELASAVIDADLLALLFAGNLGESVIDAFNRKSIEIGSRVRLAGAAL